MARTILCVDGSDSERQARSRALRRAGFTVVEAGNGADALNLAAEAQPSLILLGSRDAGGFALSRRLKEDPRTSHIPVLHVSEMDEERLRQSRKLESVGVLAAGVAHDFNNLLLSVMGNASLARELLPADNPAAGLLDGIVKAGEQAAHLTRQMLAYSGRGKFLVEAVNLSELIAEIGAPIQASIPQKIALRLHLDADLPSIQADRGQMRQMFTNLVLNAAEATGGPGGAITVKTSVQELDPTYIGRHPEAAELAAGRYVRLEVSDAGCGMDDATKARIFDPFFSMKFTGRGLGLAAVAGIVRGHKGAILVTSAPGEGACFTVLLPAAGPGE
jgi:two-component system cell cycle sensor histidine kinase/response regulator CckA